MSGNNALAGKTAFVTGGAGSIGSHCAKLLLRDGAAVLIMGRRKDALEKTRTWLLESTPNGRVEIHAGDACEEKDVRAALDQAFAMQNRLDIIVPTVGGGGFKPLLMMLTLSSAALASPTTSPRRCAIWPGRNRPGSPGRVSRWMAAMKSARTRTCRT